MAPILSLLIAVIAIYLTVAVGYLLGMLLAITPFVQDWLTVGGVIDTAQMPGIVAWIMFIALMVGAFGKTKGGE